MSSTEETSKKETKKPTCLLFIGMAGTGKTTLLQRINAYLSSLKSSRYIINLDPAVAKLPYSANVDIRDTVNFKQVMKQYQLGPNGGILTALNLFTTKFDQVLDLIEKKSDKINHVLIDTPGQIEIFTWSASGAIITDTVSASYPTVVLYIIDTPRSASPTTFMSNMLYAVSILYKTKLPFVLVFNKTDGIHFLLIKVVSHEFCLEWMKDYEAFQFAMEEDSTYMGSLISSMSLVLEEFYQHLRVVGVSAVTGEGMEELFEAIQNATKEYETEYQPQLQQIILNKQNKEKLKRQENLEKLIHDIKLDQTGMKS
ncbi:hypothetical protein HDV02_005150 [Globomyces sp. JEL0801]|nr:hypothetical protein HDV02_005150 [Globomyces sp. JEL0801]